MPITNVPDWQMSEALNHAEIMHEMQTLTMFGWSFEMRRDEEQSAFVFTAKYPHFFKSRKFIESDVFFDWAAHRMVQRIYKVMNEYAWQYPKYNEYLKEKDYLHKWNQMMERDE